MLVVKNFTKIASIGNIRTYSADAAEVNGGRNKVSIYDRMLAEDAGYNAGQAQAMQTYNPRMLTAIRNGKHIGTAPKYYVDPNSVPSVGSSTAGGALKGALAGAMLSFPIIAMGSKNQASHGKWMLGAAGLGSLAGGLRAYKDARQRRDEVDTYNKLVSASGNNI